MAIMMQSMQLAYLRLVRLLLVAVLLLLLLQVEGHAKGCFLLTSPGLLGFSEASCMLLM